MILSVAVNRRYNLLPTECFLHSLMFLQSYIQLAKGGDAVQFYGNLDITALGGAGFASQRTTGEDRRWDLSAYDGMELRIKEADCNAQLRCPP
jgi:hypothetical protein